MYIVLKIINLPGCIKSGATSFARIRACSESILACLAAISADSAFARAFLALNKSFCHYSKKKITIFMLNNTSIWQYQLFVELFERL